MTGIYKNKYYFHKKLRFFIFCTQIAIFFCFFLYKNAAKKFFAALKNPGIFFLTLLDKSDALLFPGTYRSTPVLASDR